MLISAGRPRKSARDQFGIFLEEINHAGDGGLYNELIRNGSFTKLQHWMRGRPLS